MRLLVVDDDRALRDVLRRALSLAGYEVRLSETGAGALSEIGSSLPDAVVLDVGLPDIDGLEVCRLLRREGNRVPVLMLTARDTVSDRIDGLDAGADDYLGKPFAFAELLARIRALIRRPPGLTSERLAAGTIVLDPLRHQVTVEGRSELLSAREYALLGYLIRNAGNVVTRQQILDSVWGAEPDVYSNVVDLYVHYLRRKLAALGLKNVLRTVRGVGYALNAS